jgi:hypothetical protein
MAGVRTWSVLPDDEDAVAQREALARVGGYRGIERGVADGDASRSGNRPPDAFVVPIPHLDSEGQIGRDVVEVRIRQLPQKLVYPFVQGARIGPKLGGLRVELFEEVQSVELAVVWVLVMRTYHEH